MASENPLEHPSYTPAAAKVPLLRSHKRSSNACNRCRRQKIKCTETRPCAPCSKRKVPCQSEDSTQSVVISREYLRWLEERAAASQEQRDQAVPRDKHNASQAHNLQSTQIVDDDDIGAEGNEPAVEILASYHKSAEDNEASDEQLTNLLSTGASVFSTSHSGRQYYLGTSSNWSFTRRIFIMAHEHFHGTATPSSGLLFDGETYDLTSDVIDESQKYNVDGSGISIPTRDHATHLINAVKFHFCQLFHLYDEEEFSGLLDVFYSQPPPPLHQRCEEERLWYIHFLVLLGLGKGCVSKCRRVRRPVGSDFFLHAVNLLPNIMVLSRVPMQSVEILICVALYLHCLDHRSSAYIYIGQAKRLAMSQGMHSDVSVQQLGLNTFKRYKSIWATVHALDQELTSWQGLPQSTSEGDICGTPTPSAAAVPGSPNIPKVISVRVKLSQIIARINRALYSPNGQMDGRFLSRTKKSLPEIVALTDTLRHDFPLDLGDPSQGISRISAHMHLLYHQCIILATRPVLFCLFKLELEQNSSIQSTTTPRTSPTVRGLVKMCLDSCASIVRIIEALQNQELLDTFLVFDLEALSISTVNILLAPFVGADASSDSRRWPVLVKKAYSAFEELVAGGNRIAELELSELRQIEQLLAPASNGGSSIPRSSGLFTLAMSGEKAVPSPRMEPPLSHNEASSLPAGNQDWDRELISPEAVFEEPRIGAYGFDSLSTDQIMELADDIDVEHEQWMSQIMHIPGP